MHVKGHKCCAIITKVLMFQNYEGLMHAFIRVAHVDFHVC